MKSKSHVGSLIGSLQEPNFAFCESQSFEEFSCPENQINTIVILNSNLSTCKFANNASLYFSRNKVPVECEKQTKPMRRSHHPNTGGRKLP